MIDNIKAALLQPDQSMTNSHLLSAAYIFIFLGAATFELFWILKPEKVTKLLTCTCPSTTFMVSLNAVPLPNGYSNSNRKTSHWHNYQEKPMNRSTFICFSA